MANKSGHFGFVISFLFVAAMTGVFAGASAKEMPRKWGSFELGENVNDMGNNLTLFQCHDPNSETRECKLMGYPQRDDFVILKIFRSRLVSIAEFRYGADWEKTFINLKDRLDDPNLPDYRSDRAVSHIWQDSRTYITLTRLIKINYIVYEIRDRTTEPLYRRSVSAPK